MAWLVATGARRAVRGAAGLLATSVPGAQQRSRATTARLVSVLAPKRAADNDYYDVTSSSSSSCRPSPVADFRPSADGDTRKGICVVGCGRMGKIRAEGILANPGTQLVSVVDPDRKRATELASRANVPAFW